MTKIVLYSDSMAYNQSMKFTALAAMAILFGALAAPLAQASSHYRGTLGSRMGPAGQLTERKTGKKVALLSGAVSVEIQNFIANITLPSSKRAYALPRSGSAERSELQLCVKAGCADVLFSVDKDDLLSETTPIEPITELCRQQVGMLSYAGQQRTVYFDINLRDDVGFRLYVGNDGVFADFAVISTRGPAEPLREILSQTNCTSPEIEEAYRRQREARKTQKFVDRVPVSRTSETQPSPRTQTTQLKNPRTKVSGDLEKSDEEAYQQRRKAAERQDEERRKRNEEEDERRKRDEVTYSTETCTKAGYCQAYGYNYSTSKYEYYYGYNSSCPGTRQATMRNGISSGGVCM